MNTRRWLPVSLALVVGLPCIALQPRAVSQEDTPGRGGPEGMPDLVGALKASEGCLGVETAWTGSKKSVIFAWFKDLEACLDWYYNETHLRAMELFIPDFDSTQSEPLAHLQDDVGPILTIASITYTDRNAVEGIDLPISQISIELYSPIAGGVSVGGRFAPDALAIPHHRDVPLVAPTHGKPGENAR